MSTWHFSACRVLISKWEWRWFLYNSVSKNTCQIFNLITKERELNQIIFRRDQFYVFIESTDPWKRTQILHTFIQMLQKIILVLSFLSYPCICTCWLILCTKNEGLSSIILGRILSSMTFWAQVFFHLAAAFSGCIAYLIIFQIRLIILAKSLRIRDGREPIPIVVLQNTISCLFNRYVSL